MRTFHEIFSHGFLLNFAEQICCNWWLLNLARECKFLGGERIFGLVSGSLHLLLQSCWRSLRICCVHVCYVTSSGCVCVCVCLSGAVFASFGFLLFSLDCWTFGPRFIWAIEVSSGLHSSLAAEIIVCIFVAFSGIDGVQHQSLSVSVSVSQAELLA